MTIHNWHCNKTQLLNLSCYNKYSPIKYHLELDFSGFYSSAYIICTIGHWLSKKKLPVWSYDIVNLIFSSTFLFLYFRKPNVKLLLQSRVVSKFHAIKLCLFFPLSFELALLSCYTVGVHTTKLGILTGLPSYTIQLLIAKKIMPNPSIGSKYIGPKFQIYAHCLDPDLNDQYIHI